MRLGAYDCELKEGSKAFEAYSQAKQSTPLALRRGAGGEAFSSPRGGREGALKLMSNTRTNDTLFTKT
jgi:hypothetical protein